jgi:glucose uptake protein GlcU
VVLWLNIGQIIFQLNTSCILNQARCFGLINSAIIMSFSKKHGKKNADTRTCEHKYIGFVFSVGSHNTNYYYDKIEP